MYNMLSMNFMLALTSIQIIMIVIWVIVIIGALIIEFETAELVSIWFGAGGIGGLICAILQLDIWAQVLVFAIVSGLFVMGTRPFVKKISDNRTILTNADRLIGKTAIVTKEIKKGLRGEVLVEYQNWSAISKNNKEFKVGDNVVIIEISGNKMIVEEIESINL